MSGNGDSSSEGAQPGDGAVPKLSIGQRVLTVLPNLQRPSPTAPRRPPGRAGGEAENGTPADPPGRTGGGGDTDVVTPDAVLAPGDGPSSPGGRLRDAFMKPPGPRQQRGAPSGMSKEELNHVIKRIDDREQVLAYSSAALGVVVGVVLTIAAVHTNPAVHAKGHESFGFIVFFEGGSRLLLSALIVLAAWKRRRSFVAFALLFLGTSMGFLFALPFWALGVWMIFRVLKWQKELAAMTGGQAPGRTAPATRGREAAEARSQARAERMKARAAGGRRSKKQPEPTGPPPNKRYTPPKTIRPRPPGT